MAAELKVGVGADVDPLKKGLKEGEKAVDQFGKHVDETLGHTSDDFKKFNNTVKGQTKQAGVAFQGMSRVMQDAAFGPGAIANNLAGLGDDFRQLSASAKESGQSIGKTLVQSLMGAGGLNLALGGLTLGFSLASFGMAAWTRAFGDSDKKVKDSKEALDDYIKSLSAVNQSHLKGGQDATKELTTVNLLFRAYQNANLPLKERKEAYRQLQEQYPDYFGNLKFEQGAAGKTKEAYDRLTNSILANARARAANDLIAKKASDKLVNDQKILDAQTRLAAIAKEIAGLTAKAKSGEISFSEAIEKQNVLYDERNQLVFEVGTLQNDNIKLTNEQLQLEKAVNDQMRQGGKLIDENTKKKEEAVTKIGNVSSLPSLDAAFNASFQKAREGAKQVFADIGLLANGQVFSHGVEKGSAPKLDLSSFKGKGEIQAIPTEYTKMADKLKEQNAMLRQDFENTFANLGQALGEAIISGENPIKAAGAVILGAMGDVLVQFGKLAIAAGVAQTALAQALTNPFDPTGGVRAIAAGIALVAIGGAVKAFAGGLSKSGSAGASGGFGSPSAPGSGFQPGAVQYAGGQQSNVFIPSMTLKGQDIVIAYNRTTALNGRMGK